MNKAEYSEYLNHPLWIKKKEEALRHYGRVCQRCGSSTDINVHHKTYSPGKMPWEYPIENFQVLCEECHRKKHNITPTTKICRTCGKQISDKYDYCFSCYKSLNLKMENRVRNLETQISAIGRETSAANANEIKRLREERETMLANMRRIQASLNSLQEDRQEVQTQDDHPEKRSNRKPEVFIVLIILGLLTGAFFFHTLRSESNTESTLVSEAVSTPPLRAVVSRSNEPKEIKALAKPDNDRMRLGENAKDFVPISQIYRHIGRVITTVAMVSQVIYAENGNVYLNLGGTYPNHKLALVIFKGDKVKFGDLKYFENRLISARGKLSEFMGRPQIIIRSPSQIEGL